MPQDLPGFYYDAEKNRYFPTKGPIPGRGSSSFSSTAQQTISKPPNNYNKKENKLIWRMGLKTAKLLQARELYGTRITLSKGKCNFQEAYGKIQASQPMIWKYNGTERISDGALEQVHVNINVPNGVIGTDILVAGGMNGSLSLYELGKLRQEFDYGVKCMPQHVWPINTEMQATCATVPGHLWSSAAASIPMRSNISCVKMAGIHSTDAVSDASFMQHVLITTLGSETSGGSVYILNLRDPLDYNPGIPITWTGMNEVTSFSCTVWTADCNSDGSRAVIGTNLGAALVNLETGMPSWVCRCKSDVLSVQLDHSGKIALCGLRNGAIVTVDARQKPEGFPARLSRYRIPYPYRGNSEPSGRSARKFSKQSFELKGNIYYSRNIFMPSSISCLASLQQYDQYFLASSMDGTIKLYDQRLIGRGAVQSYEGNINSHTRTQLGVDPTERFLLSGGEDCYLRIWSIKSGELLFEDKFSNSVLSTACWPRTEGLPGVNHSSGVWLGSQEGLFYMDWS